MTKNIVKKNSVDEKSLEYFNLMYLSAIISTIGEAVSTNSIDSLCSSQEIKSKLTDICSRFDDICSRLESYNNEK